MPGKSSFPVIDEGKTPKEKYIRIKYVAHEKISVRADSRFKNGDTGE